MCRFCKQSLSYIIILIYTVNNNKALYHFDAKNIWKLKEMLGPSDFLIFKRISNSVNVIKLVNLIKSICKSIAFVLNGFLP